MSHLFGQSTQSHGFKEAQEELKKFYEEQERLSQFKFNESSYESEETKICGKLEVVTKREGSTKINSSASNYFSTGSYISLYEKESQDLGVFARSTNFLVGSKTLDYEKNSLQAGQSYTNISQYRQGSYSIYQANQHYNFYSYYVERDVQCTQYIDLIRIKMIMGQKVQALPPEAKEILVKQHIKKQIKLFSSQLSLFQSFLNRILENPFFTPKDFLRHFGFPANERVSLTRWAHNQILIIGNIDRYIKYLETYLPKFRSFHEIDQLENQLLSIRTTLASLSDPTLPIGITNTNPDDLKYSVYEVFAKEEMNKIINFVQSSGRRIEKNGLRNGSQNPTFLKVKARMTFKMIEYMSRHRNDGTETDFMQVVWYTPGNQEQHPSIKWFVEKGIKFGNYTLERLNAYDIGPHPKYKTWYFFKPIKDCIVVKQQEEGHSVILICKPTEDATTDF
jgi:hypothetical protein